MKETNTPTTETQNNDYFTSIKIISKHDSLSEAVKASGMDLSYNQKDAESDIRHTERNGGGKAFVTTKGVFYYYECDISLLNKFEPFIHCISNSPFSVVWFNDDETEIRFSTRQLKKCKETRLFAKKNDYRLHSS